MVAAAVEDDDNGDDMEGGGYIQEHNGIINGECRYYVSIQQKYRPYRQPNVWISYEIYYGGVV